MAFMMCFSLSDRERPSQVLNSLFPVLEFTLMRPLQEGSVSVQGGNVSETEKAKTKTNKCNFCGEVL